MFFSFPSQTIRCSHYGFKRVYKRDSKRALSWTVLCAGKGQNLGARTPFILGKKKYFSSLYLTLFSLSFIYCTGACCRECSKVDGSQKSIQGMYKGNSQGNVSVLSIYLPLLLPLLLLIYMCVSNFAFPITVIA